MKTMENEPGMLAEKMARFLLGYRITPHTATSFTQAEIQNILLPRMINTSISQIWAEMTVTIILDRLTERPIYMVIAHSWRSVACNGGIQLPTQ